MIRTAATFALLAAVMASTASADEIDVLPADLWDTYGNTTPAANDDTDEEAEARLSAAYCDRYGPGYTLVPGTTTCINVGSHVQVDIYGRFSGGRGKRR